MQVKLFLAFQLIEMTLALECQPLSYYTNIDTRIDKSNQYCHVTFG